MNTLAEEHKPTYGPLKDFESHPDACVCPECGSSCMNVGLTKLVYTFEECNCNKEGYPHLVEQIHHRECFK